MQLSWRQKLPAMPDHKDPYFQMPREFSVNQLTGMEQYWMPGRLSTAYRPAVQVVLKYTPCTPGESLLKRPFIADPIWIHINMAV